MKAIWNGKILVESDDTILVEGNHYFPIEALNQEYFDQSNTSTTCFWKGEANYYNIVVDGQVNRDGAWYYPSPKNAAKHVKDRVAFWRGVRVEK